MKKPIIIPVEKKEEFKKLKKLYKKTKNVKFVEVSDKIFDRLEKGLSCIDKKIDNNDETWGLFFTDKQLKNIFGFTDEEIENLHKNKKNT